uniref:Uncharacterized protein n=1 Tax=viral metagenome TaxID=1070528 RepID=A0A6H1ZKZ6_9ZZZZ
MIKVEVAKLTKYPCRKERAVSKGVRKLVKGYEETGTVRTSRATYHPKSKKEAIKQSVAIEYGKHRIGRAGRRRRG